MIGPIVVLVLYVAFFYGLYRILGSSFILTTGNDAVTYAVRLIYGNQIGNLLILIIILAVLGVSNGMLLATMRLPQAFAERGWFATEKMARLHPRYQLSLPASLSVAGVTLFWLVVHYIVTKWEILPQSDISEMTIVFNNTSFIFLYVIVLKLYKKGLIQNKWTGYVSPILAIVSAIVLLIGGLLTNTVTTSFFLGCCLLFCLVNFLVYKHHHQKSS